MIERTRVGVAYGAAGGMATRANPMRDVVHASSLGRMGVSAQGKPKRPGPRLEVTTVATFLIEMMSNRCVARSGSMKKQQANRVTVHRSARSRIGAVKVIAFRWVMIEYAFIDPTGTIHPQGLGSPHHSPHLPGPRVYAFVDSGSQGGTH